MWSWIKKNHKGVITIMITCGLGFWLYSCESKTTSLVSPERKVNRAELQIELDTFISQAQIRVADLDRQDEFRSLIIDNALVIASGSTLNPIAIITAMAGIYGLTHGTSKVVKYAQKSQANRKANNG